MLLSQLLNSQKVLFQLKSLLNTMIIVVIVIVIVVISQEDFIYYYCRLLSFLPFAFQQYILPEDLDLL